MAVYARFLDEGREQYGLVEGELARLLAGDLLGGHVALDLTIPLASVRLLAPFRPAKVLAEALDHVFGYTCGNDLSAREWQAADQQWWPGEGRGQLWPARSLDRHRHRRRAPKSIIAVPRATAAPRHAIPPRSAAIASP